MRGSSCPASTVPVNSRTDRRPALSRISRKSVLQYAGTNLSRHSLTSSHRLVQDCCKWDSGRHGSDHDI